VTAHARSLRAASPATGRCVMPRLNRNARLATLAVPDPAWAQRARHGLTAVAALHGNDPIGVAAAGHSEQR